MNDYDIRPVEAEERRTVSDTFRAALLSGPVNDETFESGKASWDDSDALAAWDGERCVGSVSAFRFDSTVPGGRRVPTAGVTRVGVLPTHTRRGLLTRMMHRLLVESRQRSNVLATLHASETSIYRRYGFGLATDMVAAQVTSRDATPWRAAAGPGSVRLLAYGEVFDVVPPLYERVARWRVGSISRPDWWWKRVLEEASRPIDAPFGKGTFVVVHTGPDGVDDGYVHYDVDWDESFAKNPAGHHGTVHDLWGASPAVELELWRYLVGIDLVARWQCTARPVDEPVRRAMHDSRAYESKARFDDQWVRILDVDTALSTRTFGSADGVVNIGVDDPMFAANCGVWTISAGGADRADGPADVRVDVGTLSAAYLGAVSWRDLASSSSMAASDDALDRLDTLFAVRPTPFCGTGY